MKYPRLHPCFACASCEYEDINFV